MPSATIKLIPPGQGFERIAEALTSDFGGLIGLVTRALRDKCSTTPGMTGWYPDPAGIWPDRVVAMVGGRYMQWTYAVDANNTVTLGEPTEVVLSYTAVREAAAHNASKPSASENPGGGQASATGAGQPAAAGSKGEATGVFREAADGSIEVTIARAGESLNGNYYSDAALKEAVPLFEGVRMLVKADDVHTKGGGKDVRNLLGGIFTVRYIEGAVPDTGSLVGTFRPIDPSDPVVSKMTEAVRRGLAGLMGLSLDAHAVTKREKRGGKSVRVAQRFTKVNSVDLIVEPGAGGGLDRLTEATNPSNAGEEMIKQRLYEAIKSKDPSKVKDINLDTVSDEELMSLYEAVCGAGASGGAAGAGQGGQSTKQATRVTEAEDAPVTRAELALHQARGYATLAVAAATLPQPAKDKLQKHFRTSERFTEADVDQAIKDEREYLARFTESGRPNSGMPRIEVADRREQLEDMLDAFWDPEHKDHRNVRSFKEAYVNITGDRLVSGDPERSRLTESIGTDTFADVLGNSITRRLQALYNQASVYSGWRDLVSVVPVNDFRSQERAQMGGFGNLPIVAERADYTDLADPSDDKAAYSVIKRGGLAKLTMEMIKNDDVGAIRRIPIELSRAAQRTLYRFVMNFFASNPITADGLALYHATHANLFTAALDSTSFAAHRLAMKSQPGRDTGEKMAVTPRFLLVPDTLEETAVNLFRRNTNNDKTFVQSLTPDIVPVATWTDVNDWVTLADPADLPVLEVGFLDGQEEPTLLVQDAPTEGRVFTNDTITYKLRHIYGATVLVDGHKGTTKAVVA